MDALISGNIILGNSYGIYSLVRKSNQSIGRLFARIENSLIAQNAKGELRFGGTDLAEITPQIVNCTLALNSHGLTVSTNIDSGFTLVNTIVAQSQVGIEATAKFGTNTVTGFTNNLVHGNTDGFLNFPGAFGAVSCFGTDGVPRDAFGNLPADPRLSDTDFRLQTGSPAIDAGTANLAPAEDFEGQTRTLPPDLGFDEWSPSGTLLLAIQARAGGGYELLLSGLPTPLPGSAAIESSQDLVTWTNDLVVVPNPGDTTARVALPDAGAAARFYRLKLTP